MAEMERAQRTAAHSARMRAAMAARAATMAAAMLPSAVAPTVTQELSGLQPAAALRNAQAAGAVSDAPGQPTSVTAPIQRMGDYGLPKSVPPTGVATADAFRAARAARANMINVVPGAPSYAAIAAGKAPRAPLQGAASRFSAVPTEPQPADRVVASSHGLTAALGRGTQGAGAAPTWQTPPPREPGGLRDPPKKHEGEYPEETPIEEPQNPESLVALLEGKPEEQPSGPYGATGQLRQLSSSTRGRRTPRSAPRGTSARSSSTWPPSITRRSLRRP
jgi:hypothetical protein